MILSFNQPVFIPWGGFFCRLSASDRMVLLDDTLFARGFTFVNRNRLKGPAGETWLTIPVKKKGLGRQKIKDLEIPGKEHWSRKFLATLAHLYGKSIYYEEVTGPIAEIVSNRASGFSIMVTAILEFMRDYLGIGTPLVLQSGTGVKGRGTGLLVDIARAMPAREVILPYPAQSLVDLRQFKDAGIGVRFLKYTCPLYPQFRGDFIACLSTLDMLFSLGKAARKLLERSYTLEMPR